MTRTLYLSTFSTRSIHPTFLRVTDPLTRMSPLALSDTRMTAQRINMEHRPLPDEGATARDEPRFRSRQRCGMMDSPPRARPGDVYVRDNPLWLAGRRRAGVRGGPGA